MKNYRKNSRLIFKLITSSVFVVVVGVAALVGLRYPPNTDLPYVSDAPTLSISESTISDTYISTATPSADTPTPLLSSSPVVTPTPLLSPSPVVTPTPLLSPSPVVTPTPLLSPSPVVTPTPLPSPSPVITPTPLLSPSPVVTPTPMPSPSPVVTPTPEPSPTPNIPDLTVNYISNAAGCAIITLEDKTILLNTGNSYSGAAEYIDSMGITKIDYFIITNFMIKNICGAEAVLARFEIDTIIMPDMNASDMTAATRKIVNKIKESNAEIIMVNEQNVNKTLGFGKASFTLLTPLTIKYADEYDCYSIAVKLCYGDTAFLFMSDVTVENIDRLIADGVDLNADVIQVSQNGSSKYTSEELLNKVSPDYALITLPNMYYEEHLELVERLSKRNIRVVYVSETSGGVFKSNSKTVVQS